MLVGIGVNVAVSPCVGLGPGVTDFAAVGMVVGTGVSVFSGVGVAVLAAT